MGEFLGDLMANLVSGYLGCETQKQKLAPELGVKKRTVAH